MSSDTGPIERALRSALESTGQRYTEQRAAVYRYLAATQSHPTADEVFSTVRRDVPGISLATVYKSLETLVGCGLAVKLAYADGSARYDGRTDPHHHIRCLGCGRVDDVPVRISDEAIREVRVATSGFRVTGFRLELTGFCEVCERGAPSTT